MIRYWSHWGAWVFMSVALIMSSFHCANSRIPRSKFEQLPNRVKELLEVKEMSVSKIRRKLFLNRDLPSFRDTFPGTDSMRWYVFDPEIPRTYDFLDGKLLVLGEGNSQGRIDPMPNSLSRALSILGKEDLNLPGQGGKPLREYIYLKYGISVEGNQREDRLVNVRVFPTMTAEEYQKFIWVDPSYLNHLTPECGGHQ